MLTNQVSIIHNFVLLKVETPSAHMFPPPAQVSGMYWAFPRLQRWGLQGVLSPFPDTDMAGQWRQSSQKRQNARMLRWILGRPDIICAATMFPKIQIVLDVLWTECSLKYQCFRGGHTDIIYVTSSTSSASVKYFLGQVKSYRKHKKGSWNHVINYNLQTQK